jgi:hypothetical protein
VRGYSMQSEENWKTARNTCRPLAKLRREQHLPKYQGFPALPLLQRIHVPGYTTSQQLAESIDGATDGEYPGPAGR